MGNERITIETFVKKPIDQVWEKRTLPKHIVDKYSLKITKQLVKHNCCGTN
jgi:hypothetical protein